MGISIPRRCLNSLIYSSLWVRMPFFTNGSWIWHVFSHQIMVYPKWAPVQQYEGLLPKPIIFRNTSRPYTTTFSAGIMFASVFLKLWYIIWRRIFWKNGADFTICHKYGAKKSKRARACLKIGIGKKSIDFPWSIFLYLMKSKAIITRFWRSHKFAALVYQKMTLNQPTQLNFNRRLTEMMIDSGTGCFFWECIIIGWPL